MTPFEPSGAFGDIYQCNITNDPTFIEFGYPHERPRCPRCNWIDEDADTDDDGRVLPSANFLTMHSYRGQLADLPFDKYGRPLALHDVETDGIKT